MKEPDSFEDLLDKFLSKACVTYGYCIPAVDRERLTRVEPWVNESSFVEQLMLADGVELHERQKDHRSMTAELSSMIERYGAHFNH